MNAETLVDLNQVSEQQLKDLLRSKQQATAKSRRAYKDLVVETVPKVVADLVMVSRDLVTAKKNVFAYFQDVLKLKAEVFGVVGGQQSHTFSTDTCSITIGYRLGDGWDDTVTAGIAKVENFIASKAKDKESSQLVSGIFRLLKKDAKGNLQASRVLELKQMADEFNDANFSDGVNTILDAFSPVRTCWFIEAYYVDENQEKVSIPLSISAADFPDGFVFDFPSAEKSSEEEA